MHAKSENQGGTSYLDNKDAMINEVSKNGLLLRFASDKLRGDTEVVHAAIEVIVYLMNYSGAGS